MPDDRGRLQIFDLATKEYREPDQSDTMIPPEPWQPPQPPPGAALGSSIPLGGLGEKRLSGSGRPKGSKDKTQRRPRSAAAQDFEKEVISQLTAFCGGLFASWCLSLRAFSRCAPSGLVVRVLPVQTRAQCSVVILSSCVVLL